MGGGGGDCTICGDNDDPATEGVPTLWDNAGKICFDYCNVVSELWKRQVDIGT